MKVFLKTKRIACPILALALLAAGCGINRSDNTVPAQVELTRDGKTMRVIVCAPDASAPEKTAAAELADYLKRITGATFPVIAPDQAQGKPVIAVGPGAAQSVSPDLKLDKAVLGEDGIVLRTSGQNLILTGAPEAKRGTLYAVYQFLERSCGVRWWSSKAEHVPSSPTLTVAPPDQVYVPKLRYREAFFLDMVYSYHPDNGGNKAFAARSRCNGHFPKITPAYGGHYTILGWCHTFHQLIPPAKYFRDHPDWFGEIGGKRSNAEGVQLCLTSEGMRQELTRNALELIRKNPEAGIISISQVDYGKFCQCPACKAIEEREGSPSGSLLAFVNRVAEDIEKQYPDFLVETLGYLETAEPPRTLKPRHNVIVRLCPYDCSFAQPLTDPVNAKFRGQLERWKSIAPRLFIWDYVEDNQCMVQPYPHIHVLAPNTRLYIDSNAVGIFAQGDTGTTCGDFVELRAWLLQQLMWDPSQDEQVLRREFLKGFYGAAAEFLAQVIDIASQAARRSKVYLHTNRPNDTAAWLDLATLNRITALFAEAAAAVKNDPERALRVRRARFPYDFVWLKRYYALKRDAASSGLPFDGPSDPAAARDALLAAAKEFNLRGYSESVTWPPVAASLAQRFKKEPAIPAPCAKVPANDWIDVQDDALGIFCKPEYVEDAAASDAMAVRVPGHRNDWFIQYIMPETLAQTGPWHCYAMAKAVVKPGAEAKGTAFRIGLLNPQAKKDTTLATATLEETADGSFRTYDLGVHDLTGGMNFYVAGVSRPEVQYLLVDRFFFVRQK